MEVPEVAHWAPEPVLEPPQQISSSVRETPLQPQQPIQSPVTALVIGDPHFKVKNVRETGPMVEAIVRVATERRPDFIVVLGDVLDRHEVIHVSPLNRAINFLSQLMAIAPTYVIIGNHDLKNNRQFLSEEHPFPSLKLWNPERMIIADTTVLAPIKGHLFSFVPYVPPGRFVEALDKQEGWMNSTAIFAHQEFKGCKMGAIISEEGDDWPRTSPYVVSGHIHDFQEPQPNILYTGTPIQHAFGDRHDKSISFFTFHAPGHRDHERIDLGLPRKQVVNILCAEVSTYVPQDNCELKIVIKGTSGELKAIVKHPNIVAWKERGIVINYKALPVDNAGNAVDMPLNPVIRGQLLFSTALYNSVENNPRLQGLYHEIFGAVKEQKTPALTLNSPKQLLTLKVTH